MSKRHQKQLKAMRTEYFEARTDLLKQSEQALQSVEKEYLLKDSQIENQAINTGNSTTQGDLLYESTNDYEERFTNVAENAEQNLENLFKSYADEAKHSLGFIKNVTHKMKNRVFKVCNPSKKTQ